MDELIAQEHQKKNETASNEEGRDKTDLLQDVLEALCDREDQNDIETVSNEKAHDYTELPEGELDAVLMGTSLDK